jgi:hypothetical protein
MSTEQQIKANRLNAQKSTGPKTPEGKAKVAQNALTHGLFAQQPVLDFENPAEYAGLREDFFGRFAPEGVYEIYLADQAVNALWRLKRAERYETLVTNNLVARATQDIMDQHGLTLETLAANFSPEDCLAAALERDFAKDHTLRKIQQYQLCIDRTRRNSLKELHQVQTRRLKVGEASVLHSNSANSKNEKNKPKIERSEIPNSLRDKPNIPNTDSKTKVQLDPKLIELTNRLYEEGRTNPFGTDLIAKMESQKLRDRQTAKIAC